jgi:uncharacterized protein (DUF1501 family)
MKRREFIKGSAAACMLSILPAAALAAGSDAFRRLLILVELNGGNDGLNTLVPYADEDYFRLRPRIGIPREQVLQLSEREGLHPSLAPLMPLWEAGELAVVRGVGYPNPNLSHFRGIEIWDTASSSEEYLQQGWLARAFRAHAVPRNFAAEGVVVGNSNLGPLMGGSRTVAITNIEQFLRQASLVGGVPAAAAGNRSLGHILKVEEEIAQAASGLAGSTRLATAFPQSRFGNAVRTAATVLTGRQPVAAIRLSLGGFDTHQNQPGTHANLLRQLGEGLAALKEALIELGRWDSTLIMTYAEFGRRAQENASNGTDHGTANAHFVMGGRVRGGLYGQAPRLDQLDNGNLVHAVDFRSLYATVLQRWWGMDAAGPLGGRFAPLELLRT